MVFSLILVLIKAELRVFETSGAELQREESSVKVHLPHPSKYYESECLTTLALHYFAQVQSRSQGRSQALEDTCESQGALAVPSPAGWSTHPILAQASCFL